jgi:hypothetical protein
MVENAAQAPHMIMLSSWNWKFPTIGVVGAEVANVSLNVFGQNIHDGRLTYLE